MRFKSIEQFVSWLNENSLSISDIDIKSNCLPGGHKLTESQSDQIIEEQVIEESATIAEPTIEIKSLSTQPRIRTVLNEAENAEAGNVWYVDDFESVPDACSTSKIVYKGDTFLMNVCESDGQSNVNLVVEVNNEIKRMSFALKKACTAEESYDMILAL